MSYITIRDPKTGKKIERWIGEPRPILCINLPIPPSATRHFYKVKVWRE